MDVYRRYFRVEAGPLVDAVEKANKINAEAHHEYLKILAEIGASLQYYQSRGRLVGIVFDGKIDTCVFKRVATHGWYPKLNCKKGKDLVARLKAIKTEDPQDALGAVGLSSSPTVFSDRYCYRPMLVMIPEKPPVVYVSVPWYDADPEKIEEYKAARAAGTHYERNYDSILWQPTPEMVEVKKWQFERHVEEWNQKLKAEEPCRPVTTPGPHGRG